jgi:nucleotidyltransferase substrate binding protein (TIGR01987 family)
MADERFALALSAFAKALARLKEVLAENETPIVRDALIQRFEFTFEAAWKAAYRWLRARSVPVDEGAFAVLPRALALGLIADEEGWAEMRQKRNLTSHTYDEALAVEVAAFVRARAIGLFDALLAALRARAGE